MLTATRDAIKSISLADPSITAAERARLLAALNAPPPDDKGKARRIMRLPEVASVLQVSTRTVLKLAAAGSLRRVFLPGRKLAAGYDSRDIEALLDGGSPGKAA